MARRNSPCLVRSNNLRVVTEETQHPLSLLQPKSFQPNVFHAAAATCASSIANVPSFRRLLRLSRRNAECGVEKRGKGEETRPISRV